MNQDSGESIYERTVYRWRWALALTVHSQDQGHEPRFLLHVMQDCAAAMAANPDNPKCGQYADERHYCAMELERRRKAFNAKFSN